MALLRRLSSSIHELMDGSDDGSTSSFLSGPSGAWMTGVASGANSIPGDAAVGRGGGGGGSASGAGSGAHSASASGSVAGNTIGAASRAKDGLGLLDEELSGLGRTTESLLRTMRLDVVLLGSREEEMRDALAQLEGQWEILEKLLVLEEHKRTEEGGGDGNGDEEEKSQRTSERIAATIDWDGGGGLSGDEDGGEEGGVANKSGRRSLDRASSMPVASGRRKPAVMGRQQSMITEKAEGLHNSNFDWGALGDDDVEDLREASRRASMESAGEGLAGMLGGARRNSLETSTGPAKQIEGSDNKNEKGGSRDRNDERPMLMRLFSTAESKDSGDNDAGGIWGRKGSNLSGNVDDHSSAGKPGNEKPQDTPNRWGLFGGRRDDDSVSTARGSVRTNSERPRWLGGGRRQSSTNEDDGNSVTSNNPRPLWLGGGRRQSDANRSANGADEGGNPFQRMFQRRPKELDASSNTRETENETQPGSGGSPSHSSESNSSQQPDSQNSQSAMHPNMSEEDEKAISSLQVKLRGCDSASSTLQQLLAFQTRNLHDLRYQRNTLSSSYEFDSKHREAELEKLRNRLHFAKVERRRKSRLVEDASRRMKRTVDQEERLKGELESIRTELFMLKMQMGKADQRGTYGGGGGLHSGASSRRGRDKVVIVGADDGNDASERSSSGQGGGSTEWRMGGQARRRGQPARRSSPGTPETVRR